jgi:anti-sigma regulatory factor (Ser/Thr protein kinase)
LAFYTDGLVERRGENIDEGLRRLQLAMSDGNVEDVCARIMAHLVGDTTSFDDVALVVVKRSLREASLDLELPAIARSLKAVRAAMRVWLGDIGASQDDSNDLLLAVGEACMNVVEHAYGPAGGVMRVQLRLERGEVVAQVRDAGQWRPPRGVGRGRGLMLIERASDTADIARTPSGTTVTIRRHLNRGPGE